MPTRKIRRLCRAIVRTLDIPSPFSVRRFCDDLAARRGQPIALRGTPMPAGGPSGIWISTAVNDYILYETETTGLHQEHIILHEIGHLLCAHDSATTAAAATSTVFPHLNPALVRRVLRRTVYSTPEERLAETLASTILVRANRWRTPPVSRESARCSRLGISKLPDLAGRWDRMVAYRRLGSLWLAVRRGVPEIILDDRRHSVLDSWNPWAIDFRLYRRVIEIRDGVLSLRPYFDPRIGAVARRLGAAQGFDAAEIAAIEMAAQIAEAIERKRTRTALPAGAITARFGFADGNDLESELRALVPAAQALATSAIVAMVRNEIAAGPAAEPRPR